MRPARARAAATGYREAKALPSARMARTQTRPATDPASHARTSARTPTRSPSRPALPRARYPRGAAAPVLVEVRRGPLVESRHRGHVVQVDAHGRVERGIGDPDFVTSLRSAVKPFALLALVEAGGVEEFHLTDPEIAVMAASHHGEDMHVRTLQGVLRRASLSQSLLACGAEGAPLDPITHARLARDGEVPGPIRHMCSGFHVASLLLTRHGGWSLADYWHPEHPSQVAVADTVARVFGTARSALVTAVDNCGLLTYAFPLAAIARAFALLADPAAGADETTLPLVPALTRVRDAMLAAPEMVGGTGDAVDTRLMHARPSRLVSKGGAEGLRGIGLLAGARPGDGGAAGVAIKIEDGDGAGRASRAVSVEALAQLGVFDEDAAVTVPVFALAPFSELA
jgi:L-asparaginase II